MPGLEAVLLKIAAFGPRFDPDIVTQTRTLYRPLVEAMPWNVRACRSNVAYGSDERQRLDVYPASRPDSPVLLFVHGGGFVGGDKANDPPFYGNVGRYLSHHGYCAVLMNYRLAPTHSWPAGAEDVASVLAWIGANISGYGGDANRLYLLGQSAGASHVASYLFDPGIGREQAVSIRAAMLMSGFYLAEPPLGGGPAAYFGTDEGLWRERSPATHVGPHPPILLSVAQYDPAPIADQSLVLARALTRADGSSPRFVWFERENHISTVHGLGLGRDPVGTTIRDFFAGA